MWDTATVDFTSKIMKMSDNDRSIVEDICNRLSKSRYALQKKTLLLDGMEKNFTILQGMVEHMSKEIKLMK